MRVVNSTFTGTLLTQLQRLTSRQAQYQQQVATGQRITNPEDDPAAVRRVLNLQREKAQVQQFASNRSRALEISQTTYSAVDSLKKISDRAGEIAVSASSVSAPESFDAYAAETDQMLEQALQSANSKFRGDYLLGGTKTDTPPFVATRDSANRITGITYAGAAAGAPIQIDDDAQVSPQTDGTSNGQFADFLNHLVQLRDALGSRSATAVQAVQPALQTSEDQFLVTQSGLGAVQTRLETVGSEQEARFTELERLVSTDTDVDYAQTVVQLNQTQTAYQAALQSAATIMRTSLLDFLQ